MTEKLFGVEATQFITRTAEPKVIINAGGKPLIAVNNDRLAEYPAHLHGWARRWLPILDNPDAVVANSILDKREWAELDRAIIEAVKPRLVAVADLRAKGLVSRTTLAEMMNQWRVASERVRPSVNMDGRSQAVSDRTDRKTFAVPIPVIRTDFEIGLRELLASRKLGASLDTTEAVEAAASVAEEMERMLFIGNQDVVVTGNTIYGFTTLPQRIQETGTSWGTPGNIISDVLAWLQQMADNHYYGPFTLYCANEQYFQSLNLIPDTPTAVRDYLLSLPQIEDVKPGDFMPTGEVVMVQMTQTVVDWREAQGVTARQWSSSDGQATKFAVMAAGAPRLKPDYAGKSGILHGTGLS